jgi:hypothetical protein
MGVEYLILISLALMLIEPRFLCFSYSGGLLSLAALIFGIKGIDVTGILMLVAILHLVESILIFFDGHRGAIPVFLERDDGSVVGGFTMQRYWPIPLVILLFMGFESAAGGDVISTPDWWPVVRPYIEPERLQQAMFQALPIAAILGYGEFTSACLPKDKCRRTSWKLAVFSLVLFGLSAASVHIYAFKYIAALFAPLAHEFILIREKRMERDMTPLFSNVPDGIRVLDTVPDGAAEAMGIVPGDIVVSVNNKPVTEEEDLEEFFKEYVTFIWVGVKDREGTLRTLEYKNYKDGIDDLDIIAVPRSTEGLATVRERKSFIKRMFGR